MKPQIAWITGATGGIGCAIAEKFARAGIHLALNGRKVEKLNGSIKELQETYGVSCLALPGDVGDSSFVKRAFERIKEELGAVTILVNNAGISHVGLLSDTSEEEWKRILDANLNGPFYCCKYAIPQMLGGGQGKIINISSVWGEIGGSCEAAYSTTKGGLNAMTRALAKELAPSNIAVNAIACGVIDTEMNGFLSASEKEKLVSEIPMGRMGTAEEVAELALQLVHSPSYLTGQVIRLDGGWI